MFIIKCVIFGVCCLCQWYVLYCTVYCHVRATIVLYTHRCMHFQPQRVSYLPKYSQHQRYSLFWVFFCVCFRFVLHFAQFMSNNRTLSENYYVSAGLCEIAQIQKKKKDSINVTDYFSSTQWNKKQTCSMMKSFTIIFCVSTELFSNKLIYLHL